MTMKTLEYAYFPGCVAQGAARELYLSTAAISQVLGIKLIELKKASCCGSGTFKEDSHLLEDTVNARNIALAESLNLPLLTHCSTCQGVLGHVNERLQEAKVDNPSYLSKINGFLAKEHCSPYQGSTEVIHILWALIRDYGVENLAKKVVFPLKNLNCAAFYGCYLLRGQKQLPLMSGAKGEQPIDDPFNPQSLEMIFQALGATPIFYEGRTQCCGWPISSYATDSAFKMAAKHLQEAIAGGADCIVTPCPLCHLNLESRQPEIAQQIGQTLNIPVLHLPQLIGLALGIKPKVLGLNRHVVSTKSVLEKLGINDN